MSQSLLGRARERGLLDVRIHNLRDFSTDRRHHTVDDRPYGGGAGMVLQAEPIYRALSKIKQSAGKGHGPRPYVVYLSPQGQVLTQARAKELSKKPWLLLLCGHYEGIDERLMRWVDAEISIGDYVLTGGELPAMVVADVVLRLVPGVVKKKASIQQDSFEQDRLDHPHYTRPRRWRGRSVPEVLLTGDHPQIQRWRLQRSWEATLKKRPDLLVKAGDTL
jgi:tRNA (guanine37-N1)-methyltransferase